MATEFIIQLEPSAAKVIQDLIVMQNDGIEQKSGTDVARKLLQHSHGKHDLNQLIGHSRLDVFDALSPESIVDALECEDLQTQAMILAHIDARKSFEILEILPGKLRSQVLLEISKLEPIASSELEELNRTFKEKLEKRSSAELPPVVG